MNPFPGWAPVASAAETVGRSPHTVWGWVRRRLVRTIRVDQAVYVNTADVQTVAATTKTRRRSK